MAVVLLCSLAFAGGELPGITGGFRQPVEVVGSVVHLVTSFPSELSWELEVTEPAPLFEPPEEYDLLETLDCRFIVPDKEGICPAVVSLSSEAILESAEIQLTAQAQQSVDLAPEWLQGHLIWKLSILTEENQDRYGALLLAHQGQNYYDELAFTVSRISWTILANPNWDETLLVNNVQGIYEYDPFLSYVNVNDYSGTDYYSTTEYYTIIGSDTIWVEIPMDIYYNYVVMPKVSDEKPLQDSSVYDLFWREYLFTQNDSGYPLLSDVIAPTTVFWDGQEHCWSGSRPFTDDMMAVDVIGNTCSETVPSQASGNRPIQPNIIAHEHNGNCGELQDLLCAYSRICLIPTVCTMDINEDHVWCEIWWDDEWHPFQVDWACGATHINDPYIAYDFAFGGSKDCSCIWSWRNDGYTWDDIAIYTPTCTFTVTVTDSTGIPVDNATVQIASEGWQTSTLYRGTWGQTDRNGQITFILGDNQNFYLNISSSLGNYGAGGYLEAITNSVAGQDYYFEWSPPALMAELDMNELGEGSWTKYLIQVDFDLPVDIMNGRDYYANPRSEYAEPLEDGTADFFIVDSANWDLYQAGEEFDCYELLQGQSVSEVWFYAPHTDDWYIVFSGDRHQGLETFADATISLWEHDGTGISGGVIPAIEAAVYPNPCVNQASVSFATAAAGNMEVIVYDIHGRVVETLCDELLEAGSHNMTMETSELSSGLYFVKFHGEGLNSMRSLTVLR